METIPDQVLFEILVPLMDKRPGLRREIALMLTNILAPLAQQGGVNFMQKRATKKRDPALGMFYRIRRLVLLSQKQNMREAEIERQIEEEWEKLSDPEKSKWNDIAHAQTMLSKN